MKEDIACLPHPVLMIKHLMMELSQQIHLHPEDINDPLINYRNDCNI